MKFGNHVQQKHNRHIFFIVLSISLHIVSISKLRNQETMTNRLMKSSAILVTIIHETFN